MHVQPRRSPNSARGCARLLFRLKIQSMPGAPYGHDSHDGHLVKELMGLAKEIPLAREPGDFHLVKECLRLAKEYSFSLSLPLPLWASKGLPLG